MGFKNLFRKKITNENLKNLANEAMGKIDTAGISITIPETELTLQQEIKASGLITKLVEIDIWLNYWYDAAVIAQTTDPNVDEELYKFAVTYEDRIKEFTNAMSELGTLGIVVGIC